MATFGKTDIATDNISHGHINNEIHGTQFTLTEDGEVSKISLYCEVNGDIPAKCAIYDSIATVPTNLEGETAEVNLLAVDPAAWVDFVFVAPLALSAGDYYLVYFAGNANIELWYDNVGLTHWDPNAYPNFSDPFVSAGNVVREISIYATYTPSAAAGKRKRCTSLLMGL